MGYGESLRREMDAFTRRWLRASPKDFHEIADKMLGARALKVHAAEAAMKLSNGSDRNRVLEIRAMAQDIEQKMRERLVRSDILSL
jgi:hypothetical protein